MTTAQDHGRVLTLLARLHVDLDFRAAFAADPPSAMAGLGIPQPLRAPLATLAGATLDRIGTMADFHRLARLEEHLTWLDLTQRPSLAPIVAGYFRAVPPRLTNREECLAFCAYVEGLGALDPPYLGELARFERRRVEVAWGVGGAGTRAGEAFVYPVLGILEALAEDEGGGWPATAQAACRVEIKKVPMSPAVVVREVG